MYEQIYHHLTDMCWDKVENEASNDITKRTHTLHIDRLYCDFVIIEERFDCMMWAHGVLCWCLVGRLDARFWSCCCSVHVLLYMNWEMKLCSVRFGPVFLLIFCRCGRHCCCCWCCSHFRCCWHCRRYYWIRFLAWTNIIASLGCRTICICISVYRLHCRMENCDILAKWIVDIDLKIEQNGL